MSCLHIGLPNCSSCLLERAAAVPLAASTRTELPGEAIAWQAEAQHMVARKIKTRHLDTWLALPRLAGLFLVLLVTMLPLPNLGQSAGFIGARMGQHPEPRDVLRMRPVQSAGKEPEYVETRKVNWSDDDYITLPELDETQDNAKRGAAVVSFFIGLFFPFIGGFWTGLFFGFMGNSAATGEMGRYQRQSEFGRKFADTADAAGKFLDEAGMSAVKAYNWGALKLRGLRLK